ncbi:MAG: DUF4831 family protein [Prevotellaceae bacterium]|jgi:hypothetical protein|nr:DUF4831 family protein [Prevotellaceae bacterium]
MKKVIFIFLIVLFFTSVQAFAQRISNEVPENSVIYALPKTSIEISVEIMKEKYIPGPYVRYAEEQLSIGNVPTREDITYKIGKISMKPVVEADYEYMYSLPAGEKVALDASFLTIASEGLIFLTNTPKEIIINYNSFPQKNYQIYSDRIPSSPLEAVNEFVMERIKTDTGFVSISFQQSIVEKKDIPEQAAEAAKFLFNLRQRRFELITGDVDHAFSGSSLKDALNEIDRLENEYLSLFIGKHFVESKICKFYVTPERVSDKKSYPVFHFSAADGVISGAVRTSTSFTLHVTPLGKINSLNGLKINKAKALNIYYRIPEIADVQLIHESKEVCKGRMQIYQLGKEFALPFDVKIK